MTAPTTIDGAMMTDDTIDTVSKALRRAWQLGQTYWRQADSDSYKQQDKSDETQKKFEALVDETLALLSASKPAVPEGCTPVDAKMLRDANHSLATENDQLRRALAPFARLVSTDTLSWAMVEYTVQGDPEKQTFQRPQMQRAFNRAAGIMKEGIPAGDAADISTLDLPDWVTNGKPPASPQATEDAPAKLARDAVRMLEGYAESYESMAKMDSPSGDGTVQCRSVARDIRANMAGWFGPHLTEQATATQPCIAPGCYQWDGTDSCTCQKATATQPAQTERALTDERWKIDAAYAKGYSAGWSNGPYGCAAPLKTTSQKDQAMTREQRNVIAEVATALEMQAEHERNLGIYEGEAMFDDLAKRLNGILTAAQPASGANHD